MKIFTQQNLNTFILIYTAIMVSFLGIEKIYEIKKANEIKIKIEKSFEKAFSEKSINEYKEQQRKYDEEFIKEFDKSFKPFTQNEEE